MMLDDVLADALVPGREDLEHRDAFLAEARAIGDRLAASAVSHEGRCNWFTRRIVVPGVPPEPPKPAVEPLNATVYSGTAGIALFLAHLHRHTRDDAHRRVAVEAAARALAHPMDAEQRLGDGSGAWRHGYYLGAFGAAATAIEVADLVDAPDLEAAGRTLLLELGKHRDAPTRLDVMIGTAGAIPGLAALARRYGDDDLLAWAVSAGDHVLAAADREDGTMSWGAVANGADRTTGNLTGFSHGAAGIGWALLKLYEATKESRFREGAEAAFAYEAAHFDQDDGNWEDFQENARNLSEREDGRAFSRWWCHGGPGIGLSRVHAREVLGRDPFQRDVEAAAEVARRELAETLQYPGRDATPCHGFTGVAECLWLLEDALGRDGAATARRIGRYGLERFGHDAGVDWPTAHPAGEHPPLLTGVAGIGHYYLRLYDPEGTRSVLYPLH